MLNTKYTSEVINQTSVSDQAVVLLHGIWVGSWVMNRIAKRLSEAGYTVYKFSYPTVKNSPQRNAKQLAEFVKTIEQPVVHFVAHSLGGLVLLQYLNCYNTGKAGKPGRVVFLGSPLKGSSRAPRILKIPLGKYLLGKSVQQGLLGHDLVFPHNVQAGMIAGTFRMGVGMVVGAFGTPHDGTVAVNETQIEGLTEHITMRVSHTGMLTSREVSAQIVSFLQSGHFEKNV